VNESRQDESEYTIVHDGVLIILALLDAEDTDLELSTRFERNELVYLGAHLRFNLGLQAQQLRHLVLISLHANGTN